MKVSYTKKDENQDYICLSEEIRILRLFYNKLISNVYKKYDDARIGLVETS